MNIWKLILIVLAILYLLAELAYRRWIRPDCGLEGSMKTLAFSLVPLAFRAAAVNWVADHWLITLVVWSLLLG